MDPTNEQAPSCVGDHTPLINPNERKRNTSWERVKKSFQNMMPKRPWKAGANKKAQTTSTPAKEPQPLSMHKLYYYVENYLAMVQKEKTVKVVALHF